MMRWAGARVWLSVASLLLILASLSACLPGDDSGDDPTATPQPTATIAAPTATAAPTNTAPPPSPTATATTPPAPPTRPPDVVVTREIVRPTETPFIEQDPTPTQGASNDDGLFLPDDLLLILPVAEDFPEGWAITEEGPIDPEAIAAEYADPESQTTELVGLGWQRAVYRGYELGDEFITDLNTQLSAVYTSAVVFGDATGASAAMWDDVDNNLVQQTQQELAEAPMSPIGEQSYAAVGPLTLDDGSQAQVSVVWVQAGPLWIRVLAAGGQQYDVVGGASLVAETILAYTGFLGGPQIGEELYVSTMEDWEAAQLDFGSTFVQDAAYHVQVTGADGANIFANTLDVYGDVSAQVDLLGVLADPDGFEGCLMVRYAAEAASNERYSLCLNAAGAVNAYYEGYDAEGAFQSENLLAADVALDPFVWNQLQIVVRGSELYFFANGTLLGTAEHTGPTDGAVGVIVYNYGTSPAEFAFTNLTIYAVQ